MNDFLMSVAYEGKYYILSDKEMKRLFKEFGYSKKMIKDSKGINYTALEAIQIHDFNNCFKYFN
jgi:hypothetical protein